jgi:hypothetical protein
MDPTRLMTLPCTLYPRAVGSSDEYGDQVLVDGTPVVLDGDPGCWIEQTQRSERTDNQNEQAETFSLYLPSDADVSGLDRIEVEGVSYELDGPPWRAFNPRTRQYTHLQATVRRVT